MSTIQVDDTDSRFTYKDSFWVAGGQAGEFDNTSHSSTVAGAQVAFGPFNGTHSYSSSHAPHSPTLLFQTTNS